MRPGRLCGPPWLPERIHPDLVIGHERMRFLDLFRRHFLDDFLKADRGIRVPANGRQRVPHIGADKIRGRQTAPDFIIPSHTGLRACMAFHRRSQIPFKGALVIARHTETHGIHNADQLFSFSVARARRWPQFGIGLVELTRFHQVARGFKIGERWSGGQKNGKGYCAHGLVFVLFASSACAGNLPGPLTQQDFQAFDPAQAALGHSLFYDPILSGNQNIACAHCHHPDFGSGDGLSLGIGEGGQGLGPKRTPGSGPDRIAKRIPRNAPGMWNLGAKELHTFFHDGRLSKSDLYGNGFNSPAQEWLPQGLNSLLAAQALFPLVAQFEMAGNPGENEVIGAVHDRIDAAWPILAKRVRNDVRYASGFVAAFEHIKAPEEVSIVEIANALAAFMALEWQSIDSPFDQYLRGATDALSPAAARGMGLFYGAAGCSDCHSGKLLSDQKFHALGLPPFGPGRTRQWDPYARDVGRMAESNRLEDAYAFKTPMLRNVALTAPYGHNGAFSTLEAMIRHHLDPVASRRAWRPKDAALPDVPWLAKGDFIIHDDALEMDRQARAVTVEKRTLTDAQINDLVAFMHALTGAASQELRFGVPVWFKP